MDDANSPDVNRRLLGIVSQDFIKVADQLKEAVSRIRPRRDNMIEKRLDVFGNVYNNPNAFSKMSISALDGVYFVNIKEIIRLEAEDNYTHIFLQSGDRITASKTIKSYEDMLAPFSFYRVHKRHVINLNFMRKFVKGDGGYLIMDDGIKIEVSRRRRPIFMEQMKRLLEGAWSSNPDLSPIHICGIKKYMPAVLKCI